MNRVRTVFMAILISFLTLYGCASDEEKKRSHLEKGKEYFEKKEFGSAKIEFKNAIQIDPKYTEAVAMLGETLLKLGDTIGAFRTYARLAELDPDNIDAHFKLASFYLLAKQFENAKKEVDLVLNKEPDHINGLLLNATLLVQAQNLYDAAAAYERIIELDKSETRAYTGLSQVLARQGKPDEAEDILKQALALDPKAVNTRLILFGFYVNEKRFSDAEIQINEALAADPDNADLYLVLANFHSRQKNFKAAEAALLKAIETDPQNAKPYLVTAGFYNAVGKDREALATYEKALEMQPENTRILNAIARYHLGKGKPEQAKKYVTQILQLQPKNFQARLFRGQLLIAEKNYNEAINLFGQLIAEEPKSAQAHYFKGLAHQQIGQSQMAQDELGRVLELNNKYQTARLLLAQIYMQDREFELAAEQYKAILETSPDNYQTKLLLGNAYFFQRQLTEARQIYKELIEFNPKVPAAYFRLGILQRAMQQPEAALNNFEKAMAINPKLIDVFTNIIAIHIATKDFAKAHQRCDEQMKNMTDTPPVLAAVQNLKGEIYLAEGKRKDAVIWYKKTMATYPGYLRPYYALASIFRSDKMDEEAIIQYEAALKVNSQQVAPHMMLGAIYDAQKNYGKAETHYRAALEINRDFAPAANNLAYVLAMQEKELDEALRYAQQAETQRPDDPNIMDTVGLVYYKKGLYNFAIGKFSASLEKIPENATVHYHLGLAHYKEGDNKSAHQALKKALSLDENFDGAADARSILSKLAYLN